jgi:4-amino-4-deoxy-L-arabinose transferase-like glycosyltransferase
MQEARISATALPASRVASGVAINSRAIFAAVAASVVLIYSLSALGRSANDRPDCDEGWFASPGYNLATRGHMGTSVMEPANLGMTERINEYTYYIMPLNLLAQAAWYKGVGFSLFSMRALSTLWGLALLAAFFFLMRALSRDYKLALLAVALIAFDFAFLRSAANGRMDMMCAALNFAAMAVFLNLRERRLRLALLASNTLVALSGLTHPNGAMGFIALAFLVLYYDRRSLKAGHVALAAIPYAMAAIGYGLYVMNDAQLFLRQFSQNTQLGDEHPGRLYGLLYPWMAIKDEILNRYVSVNAGGQAYLKVALVAAYAAGVLGASLTRAIRRDRGFRALLIVTAIYFFLLTFTQGNKIYLYMVHIAPLYGALLAIWARHLWLKRAAPRRAIAGAIAAVALISLAGNAYVIRRNSLHNSYQPAVEFLNRNSGSSTTITGAAELSFGLNNYDSLLDDKFLGYHNGRRPDFIVIEPRYEQELMDARRRRPEIYTHMTRLLDEEYFEVYNNAGFTIYARTRTR